MAGEAQPVPVPSPLQIVLMNKFDAKVNSAGIDRAVERAQQHPRRRRFDARGEPAQVGGAPFPVLLVRRGRCLRVHAPGQPRTPAPSQQQPAPQPGDSRRRPDRNPRGWRHVPSAHERPGPSRPGRGYFEDMRLRLSSPAAVAPDRRSRRARRPAADCRTSPPATQARRSRPRADVAELAQRLLDQCARRRHPARPRGRRGRRRRHHAVEPSRAADREDVRRERRSRPTARRFVAFVHRDAQRDRRRGADAPEGKELKVEVPDADVNSTVDKQFKAIRSQFTTRGGVQERAREGRLRHARGVQALRRRRHPAQRVDQRAPRRSSARTARSYRSNVTDAEVQEAFERNKTDAAAARADASPGVRSSSRRSRRPPRRSARARQRRVAARRDQARRRLREAREARVGRLREARDNGGDLGWTRRGKMVPGVRPLALRLLCAPAGATQPRRRDAVRLSTSSASTASTRAR